MSDIEPSPFKVGDLVRYTPSTRGVGLDVMSPPEGKLVPGRTYRIERVEKESYLVVEGYRHPGGGLYWTEFSRA